MAGEETTAHSPIFFLSLLWTVGKGCTAEIAKKPPVYTALSEGLQRLLSSSKSSRTIVLLLREDVLPLRCTVQDARCTDHPRAERITSAWPVPAVDNSIFAPALYDITLSRPVPFVPTFISTFEDTVARACSPTLPPGSSSSSTSHAPGHYSGASTR